MALSNLLNVPLSVGQPILAAAGFQPASGTRGDSHSRLKEGAEKLREKHFEPPINADER
jgi:hypothetical protein